MTLCDYHILMAVTPHWVQTYLHILALTSTILSLFLPSTANLSIILIVPLLFSSSSLSSVFHHHCPLSLLQGDDGVLSFLPPTPCPPTPVSSSSAELCNCVPGKGTLAFVFLTCNTTVTMDFLQDSTETLFSPLPLKLG